MTKRKAAITKQCIQCGESFSTLRSNKKCCSLACSRRHNYPLNFVRKETECKYCKTVFIPKNEFQEVCSKPCRDSLTKIWYDKNKESTDYKIFERDNFKCIYCGKSSIEDGIKLNVDHVYPRSKMGGNDIFNLITSCSDCNNSKNSILMNEDIMLRIWNKNIQFQIQFDKDYTELVELFNKKWRTK